LNCSEKVSAFEFTTNNAQGPRASEVRLLDSIVPLLRFSSTQRFRLYQTGRFGVNPPSSFGPHFNKSSIKK
jgi:hypothetical protein